ncbi:MAG: threonine--tRNA ligase [Candidatus Pacebacteria bacterium]|nr:threonine--tRNA ligase [Candidatus Paceibacterota bacterium]
MNKELSLEHKRHTLAHLLAAAILELYPDTKNAIGPAIDNGFYYDFEFATPITDADLKAVEKQMKKFINTWKAFSHKEVTHTEAKEIFKNNPYKLELIDEIVKKGEKITLYTCGEGKSEFTDLCRGGHSENPQKEIDTDAFKLSHIAGAYWRGDEKNKMLSRIYGLAFDTKEDLEAYKKQQEEAKKRDHKKLGRELDLFTFSDLVGAGLPLWTPKGTLLRITLDNFVWELRERYGYQKVEIPHITKKDLYETSGHWQKFSDELFKITTREEHTFAMKPMNCPHHTQIYARKQWSYRELPQRYANTTMCYRDEQSGELSGLARVRAFTQDDAHVFCRMSDTKSEFLKVWDIVHEFYSTFGFKLRVRLSLHDPAQPEKYLGGEERWNMAEGMLREIAKEKKADAFEAVGEAAFYGPKLDFMAKDSIGREWQVATIQLDMNLPERFDLFCINEKGEKERIVMIHAAIMGSIERFLSILIEHTAGNFPLWLAPVQVRVLSVRDTHNEYAENVYKKLKDAGIRAEISLEDVGLGKKVRGAKEERVPYFLIIGDKDIEAKKVTLEHLDKGNLGQLSIDEVIGKLQEEIKSRK